MSHHSFRVLTRATSCLGVLLCSTAVWAQTAPTSNAINNPTTLPETVVVTATQIATPVDQIGSSVTVVTAADIAAQDQRTLPEVLQNVPGLNVLQTGGPGGLTQVFMRGTNSNHIKVLVDGIDVTDPSSPDSSFDFGQYLSNDIARVEVLRGPQSGLYGSDAIGGVINIISKPGSGPLALSGGADAGSFETFNQNLSVSGSTDDFSYYTGIEHFHSGATPVTPLDILAPGERRNPDYYDNVTASTKLGYNVASNFDVGFVGRFTNTTLLSTGDNEATGFPEAQQDSETTNQYYSRGTAHLTLFGGALDQTLGFGFMHNHSSDTDPIDGVSDFVGERTKLDYQGNIALGGGEVLVIGADSQRDAITIPLDAATITNAGFAELQSNLGDFNSALNVRYDDNDRFGGHATYRIAPSYLIESIGMRLKASLGTGFKSPTLSEMFQNFPAFNFFGNPDLQPETSIGYDAGFEQGLGDQVSFGATWYYNKIKNLINTNATETSYVNVGKAITDGVEAFATYKPWDDLSFRADYTFTEAYDEVLRQELMRRPKHKASLDARWQAMPKLSLDASLLYVSSWIDVNREFIFQQLTQPGFTTVNIAANYDIDDHFTLTGRVANLLDKHYQDPNGFLAPSLGWYLGIKVKE